MKKTIKKLSLNKLSVAWLTNGLMHSVNGGTDFQPTSTVGNPIPLGGDDEPLYYQTENCGDQGATEIWG